MKNWSEIKERKGSSGIRILLIIYKCLGKKGFRFCLYPVIFFYWLTGYRQRQASNLYLTKLKHHAQLQGVPLNFKLSSFRHFMRFGDTILEKLVSWTGQVSVRDLTFSKLQAHLDADSLNKGSMILCSHVGNIEICRALAQIEIKKTINALVMTRNAKEFNRLLKEINPGSQINLIEISTITPDIAIILKQKLEEGEWIAIVGDRTPIAQYYRSKDSPVIWSEFLGEPAPFPRGPFVLASILKCPLYIMAALKQGQHYTVHFEKLPQFPVMNRGARNEVLQKMVDDYAHRLENYCLMAPLDWFNFYNFWELPSNIREQSSLIKDPHEK